jgi:hypothetical protein
MCPQVLASLVMEVEALRAAEQLPEEDLSLSACERRVGAGPELWHSPAKLEACNKELEACKRELEACKRPSQAGNPRGPLSLQLSLQLPTASKGVQADARRSGAGAGGGRGGRGGAEAGAGGGIGGGGTVCRPGWRRNGLHYTSRKRACARGRRARRRVIWERMLVMMCSCIRYEALYSANEPLTRSKVRCSVRSTELRTGPPLGAEDRAADRSSSRCRGLRGGPVVSLSA